jgi:hypothetical protein
LSAEHIKEMIEKSPAPGVRRVERHCADFSTLKFLVDVGSSVKQRQALCENPKYVTPIDGFIAAIPGSLQV